jgi:hypothetical protein
MIAGLVSGGLEEPARDGRLTGSGDGSSELCSPHFKGGVGGKARRMGCDLEVEFGALLAAICFAASARVSRRLDVGQTPNRSARSLR